MALFTGDAAGKAAGGYIVQAQAAGSENWFSRYGTNNLVVFRFPHTTKETGIVMIDGNPDDDLVHGSNNLNGFLGINGDCGDGTTLWVKEDDINGTTDSGWVAVSTEAQQGV
jgi:hypothetical protein